MVNSYEAVTAISGNEITVGNSASFAAGDHVLLIQMQGADITTTNNSSFGDITAYNNAGNFEFGIISSVSGNDIFLQNAPVNSYDSNGKVQLVRIPVYCNAIVSDTLTCQSWDGSTGGVLVIFSNGSITLNSDIDVTGKGFRGGPTCLGPWGCGNASYFLNNASGCLGGKKGEGISIPSSNNYTGGRGKIANGGGGGNPGNSGGGGGANSGSGGLGGFEYNLCFDAIQGLGGAALDYTLGRIFLGGAGGTGFDDNGQAIFPGGNGGGIIIISTDELIGNGNNITASGRSVTGFSSDESAGGGGGGGVIILDAQTYTGTVNVNINGGNGGSTFNLLFPTDCHGPGGGGGGGVAWINQSSLPSSITVNENSGTAGLVLNPASSCYNTNFGATDGTSGTTIFNFPSLNLIPPLQVVLPPDTTICPNSSFVLNAGSEFTGFLWQDGSTDSTFTVADSGVYYVKATDSAGCYSFDSVSVALYPPTALPLFNDTTVCPAKNVLLTAGTENNSYLWQDGSTNSTLLVTLPGLYWVKVTDSIGCYGIDSVTVSNFLYPALDIGNDTSLCPGTQVLFSAGNFSSYLWQDNSTAANFIANDIGTYSVAATDSNGCIQKDTASVISFYEIPPDSLAADTIVCPNVPILLNAPKGYATYAWSDGSTAETLQIDQPGTYWLKVTNAHTCPNTDTINVKEQCPTEIFIPNAFTPNHDGLNDVFAPLGYNITEFQMAIYDRWGELIFQSSDLNDGWDGKYLGKDCEVGTYVYLISYVGELNGVTSSGTYKGNVTLLR